MTTLDQLVEAGRKILHDTIENDDDSDGGAYNRAAKVFLAAILPLLAEDLAGVAEGWPTVAAGNEYRTNGNGNFWDEGTLYDQGRADSAQAILTRISALMEGKGL